MASSQEQELKEITEKFGGKWKETRSENIEEFFREMGLNIVFRKMAALLHPEAEVVVEGADIKIGFRTPVKSENFLYKLGEEVEVETAKGKFKAKCTYEEGKLVVKQTPEEGNDSKPIETTREINEQGEMVTTIQIGDSITCKRIFAKVPDVAIAN